MNQKLPTRLAIILVCLCPALAPAQDVLELSIRRGEFFHQCTPSRPDSTLASEHLLQATVFPAFSGSIVSAGLLAPGGHSLALSNDANVLVINFPLSAPAAAGSYTFQLNTLDQGQQNLKLSLPGSLRGIPPIRVANYPDTQVVDASRDFLLAWDPVPKLNSNDRLLLFIVDTNSVQVFSPSDMPLTTTNANIPAGTFQPGTTYWAYLYLEHYFRRQNLVQPFAETLELKATSFILNTLNPAGVFRFEPNTVLGREEDGQALVTVERTQGSSQAATVDYFCTDASAHSNVNYVAIAGTLDFPPGVTNQTITVPLLDDGIATRPLTFELTLTNTTGGAGLLRRPHATVTALDSQSAPGTNLNACLVAKVRFYSQSSTNPPSQSNLCAPFRFFSSIHPRFPGLVTNAWLQCPKGVPLAMTNDGAGFLEYQVDFSSLAALSKAFPGGGYTLGFDSLTDGSFSQRLTLGAERSVPPPHLNNWQELQAAEPSSPITLQWDPFNGASGSDCIYVALQDSANEYVLRTPVEFELGALAGTNRSFTIPAGTLEYGQAYFVNVVFSKIIESKPVYPGLRNGMASVHTTGFYLHTIHPPAPRPAVRLPPPQPACPCADQHLAPASALDLRRP